MEEALKILRVLVANEVQLGTNIEPSLLQEWFEEGDLDPDQCLLGLAHAAVEGWIVSKTAGTIQITAAGVAVATGTVH